MEKHFQKRVDSMASTQKLGNLLGHLIEVHDSDAEALRQYLLPDASEPNFRLAGEDLKIQC